MKWKASWMVLALTYVVAFAANFGSFAWSFDVGWLEVVTSTLYALGWLYFFITGRQERKKMRFSAIVGAVMAVGGTLGVLVRTFPGAGLTVFALLTAGPTVTPLYGLLALIDDYDVFYLVAALIGCAWFTISFLYWKRSALCDEK